MKQTRDNPQDWIQKIIDWQIKEFKSTRTVVELLQKEGDYSYRRAIELVNLANDEVIKLRTETNKGSYEKAIEHYEKLLEMAMANKQYKNAYEIRTQLSKLQGHFTEKVEVNANVNQKTEIRIIFPDGNS